MSLKKLAILAIEAADLQEVIARYIDIKQIGSKKFASCPFHSDGSPSFCINEEYYYCFGCQKSGNAISFLKEYQNLSFKEAVLELCSMYNIPAYDVSDYDQLDNSQTDIRDQAIQDFLDSCLKLPLRVQTYLYTRGIDDQVIAKYSLGYSFGTLSDKYSEEIYKDVGLLTSNNTIYFYERLIFPIRDINGKCIAFGGRSLSSLQNPKYINSPNTVYFNKGQVVYGLYEWKQHNHKNNAPIIIVEGYMDVISLSQAGYPYAVACMGTAITQRQASIILRHANNIQIALDGDEAGQKAVFKMLRVILPLLQSRHTLEIIVLPENQDPSSYVQSNSWSSAPCYEYQIWFKNLLSLQPDFKTRLDLGLLLLRGLQDKYQILLLADILSKECNVSYQDINTLMQFTDVQDNVNADNTAEDIDIIDQKLLQIILSDPSVLDLIQDWPDEALSDLLRLCKNIYTQNRDIIITPKALFMLLKEQVGGISLIPANMNDHYLSNWKEELPLFLDALWERYLRKQTLYLFNLCLLQGEERKADLKLLQKQLEQFYDKKAVRS